MNILLNIFRIKQKIKFISNQVSLGHYNKSVGNKVYPANLKYLEDQKHWWMPAFLKNELGYVLKNSLIGYAKESGISCRLRSQRISKNVINEQKWFFQYQLDDIIKMIKTIRGIYIPLSVLCSLVIFLLGYSQIYRETALSFDEISQNVFIITYTTKLASWPAMTGILAYIISSACGFFHGTNKLRRDLTESVFNFKASGLATSDD